MAVYLAYPVNWPLCCAVGIIIIIFFGLLYEALCTMFGRFKELAVMFLFMLMYMMNDDGGGGGAVHVSNSSAAFV